MSELRILSLGAGVQSSTLLRMSLCGELPPFDAVIFADTRWEPQSVYAHLELLAVECQRARVPLYRVSAGNLRADALARIHAAQMPVHVRREDGGRGMIRRQCTSNYKLRPIRRQVRALAVANGARHVWQAIGISLDEATRMKPSGVRYITHTYPLVERRMTRGDCLLWLERNGFPLPPKSACLGCPFQGDSRWAATRADPQAWADVTDFDAALRDGRAAMGTPGMQGHLYLHGSLRPLPLVDLSTPQERGQTDFLAECEGMCGV